MKEKNLIKSIRPFIYIAPISVILILFVACSVVLSIYFSFTKYNIINPAAFAGFNNYKRLFIDPQFQTSVKNTITLMFIIVPVQTVMAISVSTFLASYRHTVLGKVANMAIFIPVLSSNAVVATIWKALLTSHIGFIDNFFGIFGIEPAKLLGSSSTALVTVALISVWKGLGYYVVLYMSGLLSIPRSYYEAATVDGANVMQKFIYITLRLLKPTIIMSVFLGVISSLQCFDIIYNMTGGGPANSTITLVYYAYNLCFAGGKAGYAMAVSNVLFMIILCMVLFQKKFIRREASDI